MADDAANHLVEILVPCRDNKDVPYPAEMFNDLRDRLVAAFGG